jgi:mycothiol synthase
VERLEGALAPALRGQVFALVEAVTSADAVAPLSEAPLLALGSGLGRPQHFLVWAGDELIGYAQRTGDGASAELTVHPAHRRQRAGTALIDALRAQTPAVRLWAHGDLDAAQATAASVGLQPVREMWQMRARLAGFAADAAPAPWHQLLPFVRGRDEDALVELNAAAFAAHPEQGALDREAFEQLFAQAWFEPERLLLAWPKAAGAGAGEGALAQGAPPDGFVWTKVTDGVGEVYVIGVHPRAQGKRLGTGMVDLALRELAAAGIRDVILYVEADNAPAVAAYRRQGFAVSRRDVQYAAGKDQVRPRI